MSRPCLRPLIIEPKKPLKTGAESRFRAKLDAHDNPTITLIIEPNPTRDNVRRTGPAAAAGHVGRDPVDASDSRSLACPETRSPSLPYTSTRSRPPLFRGGNNGKHVRLFPQPLGADQKSGQNTPDKVEMRKEPLASVPRPVDRAAKADIA